MHQKGKNVSVSINKFHYYMHSNCWNITHHNNTSQSLCTYFLGTVFPTLSINSANWIRISFKWFCGQGRYLFTDTISMYIAMNTPQLKLSALSYIGKKDRSLGSHREQRAGTFISKGWNPWYPVKARLSIIPMCVNRRCPAASMVASL